MLLQSAHHSATPSSCHLESSPELCQDGETFASLPEPQKCLDDSSSTCDMAAGSNGLGQHHEQQQKPSQHQQAAGLPLFYQQTPDALPATADQHVMPNTSSQLDSPALNAKRHALIGEERFLLSCSKAQPSVHVQSISDFLEMHLKLEDLSGLNVSSNTEIFQIISTRLSLVSAHSAMKGPLAN